MEQTKKIRIADIRGLGIRKRFRKDEHIYVDGWADNDLFALAKLALNIEQEKQNFKTFTLKNEIRVYDAELVDSTERGEIIRRPVFITAADNVKIYSYQQLMDEYVLDKHNGILIQKSALAEVK